MVLLCQKMACHAIHILLAFDFVFKITFEMAFAVNEEAITFYFFSTAS
jgi:hypothetical protein